MVNLIPSKPNMLEPRRNCSKLMFRPAHKWQLIAARTCCVVSAIASVSITSASTACPLAVEARAAVTAILDARTLRLDDGTEVRLAGLLAPSAPAIHHGSAPEEPTAGQKPPRHNGASGTWPPLRNALSALDSLVLGQSIDLAFTSSRPDRYGRKLAQVVVRQNKSRIWVQEFLLARGHARLDLTETELPCVSGLLAVEAMARSTNQGLWSHAAYQTRHAHQPLDLLRLESTFQIIEGRVAKVARSRQRYFINFGRHRYRDFTIGLGSRIKDQLRLRGIDVTALAGSNIRVRGWLERRGGPYIYLSTADQLEILDTSRRDLQ